MAPSTSRLAIDLSTSSVRVVEGALGASMRCGSAAIPAGAAAAGKISDPDAVARSLKALLARTEIVQTRALVAAGDALGTFRILKVPVAASSKQVDAAVARDLPFEPQRTATRWLEVPGEHEERVVYAVAWDRVLLRNLVDSVRRAGVEPSVVELKSATVARTVPTGTCVLIDLCAEPAELVLIDRHLPRLWHSFGGPDDVDSSDADALARAVRSMLRFYRRSSGADFGDIAPVFVSSEQTIPAQTLAELSARVNQPAHALPAPPRIPGDLRHPTYLACLGLLMRRGGQ